MLCIVVSKSKKICSLITYHKGYLLLRAELSSKLLGLLQVAFNRFI